MDSSRRVGRGELPKDLLSAQWRFQEWRNRRTRGSRIPQTLWTVAVRLAKRRGVGRTSAVLRLDYYSLRTRVEAAESQADAGAHAPAPKSTSPTFVELPAPVIAGRQCLLELDNGSGVTLRLQLTGYEAADVADLAHGLWKRE